MLILLALACQPEDASAPVGAPAAEDTAADTAADTAEEDDPYIYEPDEEDAAAFSIAEVEMGVEQLFETLLLLDPRQIRDTYGAFYAQASNACPITYDYGYEEYWYDTCETPAGVQFSGYAYGYDYEDYQSTVYWYERNDYFYGDGEITLTDGSSFEIAGYSRSYEYVQTNNSNFPTYTYHTMYGEFAWHHDVDDPNNWLDDAYDVDYAVYSGTSDAGGHYIKYDGNIGGLTGMADTAIFEDFYLQDESWGADCGLEPSGSLSIRDSEGEWYIIEFQGALYSGGIVFMPDCDGCGDVWYNGENLGQACPDFSALFDWTGVPWVR